MIWSAPDDLEKGLFFAAISETYVDGYASEFCNSWGMERLNENNTARMNETSPILLPEFIFI